MTDTAPHTADALVEMVTQLEREIEEHEAAATARRQTLDDLRKRLNSATGARAGKNARSGKRKAKSKPLDTSDAAAHETAGAPS